MFDFLQTVFFTLIALGILVTFHEFGHFWVARRCGVRVLRFSIGFGTPLLRWHDKQGTEFVIAALPLGGYVKMVDEREGDVGEADLPYAFTRKTLGQRAAVVAAGPIANFLLALFFFWGIFLAGEADLAPVIGEVEKGSLAERAGLEAGMEIIAVGDRATTTLSAVQRELFNYIGSNGDIPFTVTYADSSVQYQVLAPIEGWLRDAEEPSPLRELGISPPFELESLTFAEVMPESAAEAAGLRDGDVVRMVDGEQIASVSQFVGLISAKAGQLVSLEIERAGTVQTIAVMPQRTLRDGVPVGQIGVQLSSYGKYPDGLVRAIDYNLFTAFLRGAQETWDMSLFVANSVVKLVVGELSAKNLSGPITIAKVAGDSARSGLDNFVRFVAILSIMLGVMNLLPIPVLDGGHLMYYLIEAIKGSPVSERAQMMGFKIGFAVVMGLMLIALYNDFTRF